MKGPAPAKFFFEVDQGRHLVRISMSGFFRLDDIRAFLAARREAHALLECEPNDHLTLNDIRGMTAQPQLIVDTFQGILASSSEFRSRRLAFVVRPSVARSQVIRALASREARCFTDPAAAEAWLFAEEADPAPIRRADI
jgi:hypothetical protein